MLEFWDFMYMGIFVLIILVLKEIIEYVFITRRGRNVINIEETISNTKTNEIGTKTRFKKKKGCKDNDVVEGFDTCVTPSSIDDVSGSIASITNCDRATWLFCDANFDKLRCLLNGVWGVNNGKFSLTTSGGDIQTGLYNSDQKGGNIYTFGGYINTRRVCTWSAPDGTSPGEYLDAGSGPIFEGIPVAVDDTTTFTDACSSRRETEAAA
jgi:hypothetical protein